MCSCADGRTRTVEIVTQDIALWGIAILCLVFGLWKSLWPEQVLALRERHPQLARLDLYAFLYRGERAASVVRVNGVLLLLIALALGSWLSYA